MFKSPSRTQAGFFSPVSNPRSHFVNSQLLSPSQLEFLRIFTFSLHFFLSVIYSVPNYHHTVK